MARILVRQPPAVDHFSHGLLGVEPYFDEPFYVGFQIGGYELGLDPDVNGVTTGNNAVAYWGVPDIESAHARMLLAGAKVVKPIANVGGDIKVAMVADPFGNIIGLIENPHFRPEGDIQPAVGA